MRVLTWIEKVDWASQRGEPRPIFQADDGGPIFPVSGDEHELWWLTEMSKRKAELAAQAAQDAIEEGLETSEEEAATEVEEEHQDGNKDNKLLSDDDPLSSRSPLSPPPPTLLCRDDEAVEGSQIVGPGLPFARTFTPDVTWSSQQQTDSLGSRGSTLE